MLEMLLHGNVDKKGALEIADVVERILKPKPLPLALRYHSYRTFIIPEGASYIFSRDLPNADNPNSAIMFFLMIGENSLWDPRLRACTYLFEQVSAEACFDQLRTKEQLGYNTYFAFTQLTGVVGLQVMVQSERDPVHLEHRIEAFLEKMK
ncbi:Insulinase (Peptidase M16), partial [Quaeritorhiza haematococci]